MGLYLEALLLLLWQREGLVYNYRIHSGSLFRGIIIITLAKGRASI